MPALDLIARLNQRFTQLQLNLSELQSLLGNFHLLIGRVFELPEVEKGQEHAAIEVIPVAQHVGAEALAIGLAHFQRMFIYHQKHNTSAKAAIRLPGALCFAVDDKQYQAALTLIDHINLMKTELSHMITVESQLP